MSPCNGNFRAPAGRGEASHGRVEIRRAIQRKQLVLEDPARYTSKLTSKEV